MAQRYFKVKTDGYIENIGGYDPDDEWSRDSTAGETYPVSLKEVSRNSYFDLVVDAPKDTTEFYIVYVQYKTGDSFGRDGGQLECVSLHTDKTIAEQNKDRIQQHHSTDGKKFGASQYPNFSVVLLTDSGKEFQVHTPWNGYFEQIDDVCVDSIGFY